MEWVYILELNFSFTAIVPMNFITPPYYIYIYTLLKLEYTLVHYYVCDMLTSLMIKEHLIHVSNASYILFQSM